ncbi:MAG: glycosyltransferase family 2 protein [Dehalococcoidia bacterium]|nr:glycosyltransferase family 2 protein [Dehalococcoidia bacterium]MCA9829905.1 glycosyltransferase family 2 protein [Dehalococcoidia bacterium]MCB9486746.1 glycosyltransferase family 2 protein [Thermoflexaceae bacterium]
MNAVLILPARNEAECIEEVIAEARQHFSGEIIVVDNGSSDDTAERAAAVGARVVREPVPGYGRACMAGVRAAPNADAYVFMDADGSDCPEDIPELLAALEDGAGLALGVRTGTRVAPGSIAPAARFGNWLSGTLIGMGTGRKLRDLSPLKALTRETLNTIALSEMTYGWTVELLAVAASKEVTIKEVETGYRHRMGGRSKVSGTVPGSIRAGYRILFVLGRAGTRQMGKGTAGGAAAATVLALTAIAAYTTWLFAQRLLSRDVLVSSWLLAWPTMLAGALLGTMIGSVFSRGRKGRDSPAYVTAGAVSAFQ